MCRLSAKKYKVRVTEVDGDVDLSRQPRGVFKISIHTVDIDMVLIRLSIRVPDQLESTRGYVNSYSWFYWDRWQASVVDTELVVCCVEEVDRLWICILPVISEGSLSIVGHWTSVRVRFPVE